MYCLCFCAQWRSDGVGGKAEARASERKPWEHINTLFSHLKTRNLD